MSKIEDLIGSTWEWQKDGVAVMRYEILSYHEESGMLRATSHWGEDLSNESNTVISPGTLIEGDESNGKILVLLTVRSKVMTDSNRNYDGIKVCIHHMMAIEFLAYKLWTDIDVGMEFLEQEMRDAGPYTPEPKIEPSFEIVDQAYFRGEFTLEKLTEAIEDGAEECVPGGEDSDKYERWMEVAEQIYNRVMGTNHIEFAPAVPLLPPPPSAPAVSNMPAPFTFDVYAMKAASTAIYPHSSQRTLEGVNYCTLGLVGEAGELANKLKKIYRDKDQCTVDTASLEAMRDELGDVLWYLTMLAHELGTSLDVVAMKNLEKLADRKERGVIGGTGDKR